MYSFPLHLMLITSSQELLAAVRQELSGTPAELVWKSSRQAVSRLDRPDVILLETDDLSELPRLKATIPGAPVIVVGVEVDYQWGLAAIREGASDYLASAEMAGGNLYRVLRFWVERWKVERALQQSDSQLVAIQRMEALGRTVAGVAHDFRHFLQVVYGNCNLMKRLNDRPDLEEMINEIKLAAEKANRLIGQMLSFAQGSPATRTTFDIRDSLEALRPLYAKLLAPGIKLECHYATEPLLVSMDNRFEQVIMNLIVNAGDAIGAERGTILVETRPLNLDRGYLDRSLALDPGSYVVLSVSDTGTGIDARDLDHIFDPFFTTKGRDVGTGLGLSVVFSFLQEWRGHIKVASIPGKGTTFDLIFPRQGAPLEPSAPLPQLGRTFQLREPIDAIQLVLRRDLTALGCETILRDTPGPTLRLEGDENSPGLQVCQLSPRLVKLLGLLPEGASAIETPFSRTELGRAVQELVDCPGRTAC